MSTVLKIALGVILGLAVIIVGCTALLGSAIEDVEQEQAEHAITLREFRSVKQGTRQRAIVRRFGRPDSSQEFEQQIPELQNRSSRSSCIYYAEQGKPLFEGRSFQLCFDEGRLTSKNIY